MAGGVGRGVGRDSGELFGGFLTLFDLGDLGDFGELGYLRELFTLFALLGRF